MPVKNIIPGQRVAKEKLERARELRREMTRAENILWEELRRNKLGVHFRRQQVIAGFIVDFYCHELKLIIEVDGLIHEEDKYKRKDEIRDDYLTKRGYTIIRYWNEEIQFDIEKVIDSIKQHSNRSNQHPTAKGPHPALP